MLRKTCRGGIKASTLQPDRAAGHAALGFEASDEEAIASAPGAANEGGRVRSPATFTGAGKLGTATMKTGIGIGRNQATRNTGMTLNGTN